MSTLSNTLLRLGVPKTLLDFGQDLIGKWKAEMATFMPTAADLADSVRRQPQFKVVYRALTAEQQGGVDRALETICAAALVKVRKAFGL